MRTSGSTFGIFSRSVKDRKLTIQNENLLIHVIETHVTVCNQVQKTKIIRPIQSQRIGIENDYSNSSMQNVLN